MLTGEFLRIFLKLYEACEKKIYDLGEGLSCGHALDNNSLCVNSKNDALFFAMINSLFYSREDWPFPGIKNSKRTNACYRKQTGAVSKLNAQPFILEVSLTSNKYK